MNAPPGPLLTNVAAVGAVALALAVIGPFGTFGDLGFGARLGYWGTIVALNWLQVGLLSRLLVRRLPPGRVALLAAAGGVSAVAAVAATAEVAALERLFRPALELPPLPLLYLWVLVTTLAITLAVTPWQRRPGPPPPAPAEETATGEPADSPFFRRLPPELGQDLLCLEMEDHYVRVHTRRGSALILLRLKDAEAELAGYGGLRVHRSWWVARRAVRRLVRESGRLALELDNGLVVPVSRSYAAAVRTAGWGD